MTMNSQQPTTNMVLSHFLHRLWVLRKRKVLKSILHFICKIFISPGNSSGTDFNVNIFRPAETVLKKSKKETTWHFLWQNFDRSKLTSAVTKVWKYQDNILHWQHYDPSTLTSGVTIFWPQQNVLPNVCCTSHTD